MSVKSFGYGFVIDGNSGPFVKCEDYAELEQKLAESQREFRAADATIENLQMQVDKLAAENAGLKGAFGPGDAVMNFLTIALRHTTYDQIDLDDVTLAFKMSLPETPATDAFLAEVRASVVDEVCLKISNVIPNCYQDELVGLDMAAGICGDFASEIRKGVRS